MPRKLSPFRVKLKASIFLAYTFISASIGVWCAVEEVNSKETGKAGMPKLVILNGTFAAVNSMTQDNWGLKLVRLVMELGLALFFVPLMRCCGRSYNWPWEVLEDINDFLGLGEENVMNCHELAETSDDQVSIWVDEPSPRGDDHESQNAAGISNESSPRENDQEAQHAEDISNLKLVCECLANALKDSQNGDLLRNFKDLIPEGDVEWNTVLLELEVSELNSTQKEALEAIEDTCNSTAAPSGEEHLYNLSKQWVKLKREEE